MTPRIARKVDHRIFDIRCSAPSTFYKAHVLIEPMGIHMGKSSTVAGDSAKGHEQAAPRRKLNPSEDASRLLLKHRLPPRNNGSTSNNNNNNKNNKSELPTSESVNFQAVLVSSKARLEWNFVVSSVGVARKDVSWSRGKREVKAPSRFLLRFTELQPQAEEQQLMRRKQAPASSSSSLRFGRKRYRGSTRVLDRQRKRQQLASMLESSSRNAASALASDDQNEPDNTNKTESNDEVATSDEEATRRVRRTVVIIFVLIFVATTASGLYSCYRNKKAESREKAAPDSSSFGMYRKKAASVDSASFANASEKKTEEPGSTFFSFFGKKKAQAEEIPPFYW
ncbi:unnamed protein product [Trichogramma brassicae]|uniref:Uncharacterized protein n=1 Tax=Trichogramma brassicae TaxID=86971 RepID=A0A6H5HVN4_9HYME|nr:unnamed protein product [Trichogramma brassicae]